jgi:hypothetical protein
MSLFAAELQDRGTIVGFEFGFKGKAKGIEMTFKLFKLSSETPENDTSGKD